MYQAVISGIRRLSGLSGGYTGREKYQAVILENWVVIYNFLKIILYVGPFLGLANILIQVFLLKLPCIISNKLLAFYILTLAFIRQIENYINIYLYTFYITISI